jgi:hypothetical protein
VLVLGAISVVQTVLIVVIGLAGAKMPSHGALIPGSPLIELTVGLAVLCVVSMLLGLAVSTLVSKGDQTMPALVGIVMIQVVLSGGVFPLTGVETYVAAIAPARWGLGALSSTINLNLINQVAPGTAPDLVWAHTSDQWLKDMALMIVIGLIGLIIARIRLGKMGPHRRK